MEELVGIILQILIELAIQMFGSSTLTWGTNSKIDRSCGIFLIHGTVGGILGFVSVLVSPHLILPNTTLRVANLIASPLLAGLISYVFASWMKKRGQRQWEPETQALYGVFFAFMFGLVRFALGKT